MSFRHTFLQHVDVMDIENHPRADKFALLDIKAVLTVPLEIHTKELALEVADQPLPTEQTVGLYPFDFADSTLPSGPGIVVVMSASQTPSDSASSFSGDGPPDLESWAFSVKRQAGDGRSNTYEHRSIHD